MNWPSAQRAPTGAETPAVQRGHQSSLRADGTRERIVARLPTLLGLIMVTAPELYRSFACISSTLLTSSEDRSIARLYASIDDTDFSRDVLTRRPVNLAVLPVHGCEWSDLGEPARVIDVLSRQRIQPRWKPA
jgi:hypothetical protein